MKDRRDYCRVLTSYATLINENDDLGRLKALAIEMKNHLVFVGVDRCGEVLEQEGWELFKSVVLPVVKENIHFVEYLQSIVCPVC